MYSAAPATVIGGCVASRVVMGESSPHLVRCARSKKADMNKWSTPQEPYIAARWQGNDTRPAVVVDPTRGLYIPRKFEAAIVTADLHVLLELEATAALREIFDAAGQKPPTAKGDAVIKRATITTDRFAYLPPERARIPFATYTKMAVAAAAGTRSQLQEGGGGGMLGDWRKKTVTFEELARRRRGRPRLEENDGVFLRHGERLVSLDEVLAVRNASATPTKAVMEHFGVERSTAQRWSRRAAEHRSAVRLPGRGG